MQLFSHDDQLGLVLFVPLLSKSLDSFVVVLATHETVVLLALVIFHTVQLRLSNDCMDFAHVYTFLLSHIVRVMD